MLAASKAGQDIIPGVMTVLVILVVLVITRVDKPWNFHRLEKSKLERLSFRRGPKTSFGLIGRTPESSDLFTLITKWWAIVSDILNLRGTIDIPECLTYSLA
jgi:hypothetical protein